MNDHSDAEEDPNGDGEGVWSPDIEQCFREALLLFPPCGRRKHILQEEGGGKMYGRNELIARHIRMRTGKIRSRKQVSSHIQVLARRKAKAEAGPNGGQAPAGSTSPSSSVGVSNSSLLHNDSISGQQPISNAYYDHWADRPIVTAKIRLVEFSAFIEYRRQLKLSSASGVVVDASKPSSAPIGGLAGLATAAIDHGAPIGLMAAGPLHQHGLLAPAYNLDQSSATPVVADQQHHLGPQAPHHMAPSVHFTTNQSSQVATPNSYQLQQGANANLLQQPLNNNQQHHQQMNQRNTEANNFMLSTSASPMISNYQQQPTPTSSGFTRHSYVKIDYRQPICRQADKLERIDIGQVQDKFPEISGSEGLFQRGPSDAFFLVKFWADINNDFEYNIEDQNSYFGFSCSFETVDPFKDITCSTKACSYGLQVVEKVEKIYGAFNSSNGRYSYDINRSPMCEFMIQFIKKLRQLPRASQMNSVLENFTVLQVITSESTSEILLCLAFVFEISSAEQNEGTQYHVYKLTKE